MRPSLPALLLWSTFAALVAVACYYVLLLSIRRGTGATLGEQFEFPERLLVLEPRVVLVGRGTPPLPALVAGARQREWPTLLSPEEDHPIVQWTALSVTNWPLGHEWGAEEANEVLRDVKLTRDTLVCPGKAVPGQQLPDDFSRRDSYTVHNLTLSEFMRRALAGQEGRQHVYYAGIPSQRIMHHLAPYKQILADPGGEDLVTQTLWMCDDGMRANLHYDVSANVVVQVSGSKTWTLFPPSSLPYLYIYPSIHRHYHSSQVDLDNPMALRYFPLLDKARGMRVTLRPGDALYIPPYWSHFVQAHGSPLSVASSILAPSKEEAVCFDVLWSAFPFKERWSMQVRAVMVLALLDEIFDAYNAMLQEHGLGDIACSDIGNGVDEGGGGGDGHVRRSCVVRFIRENMLGRFVYLTNDLLSEDVLTEEFRTEVLGERGCLDGVGAVDHVSPSATLMADFREAADAVAKKLGYLLQGNEKDEDHRPESQLGEIGKVDWQQLLDNRFAIASSCLADLTEGLVRYAVGRKNVVAFLHNCIPRRISKNAIDASWYKRSCCESLRVGCSYSSA